MSGTACSFWQKVLMAALSKVLVQVTEQSILRWMRERDGEREWKAEKDETGKSSALSGTGDLFVSCKITSFRIEYKHWHSALINVGHMKSQWDMSTVNIGVAYGCQMFLCHHHPACVKWLTAQTLSSRLLVSLLTLVTLFSLGILYIVRFVF